MKPTTIKLIAVVVLLFGASLCVLSHPANLQPLFSKFTTNTSTWENKIEHQENVSKVHTHIEKVKNTLRFLLALYGGFIILVSLGIFFLSNKIAPLVPVCIDGMKQGVSQCLNFFSKLVKSCTTSKIDLFYILVLGGCALYLRSYFLTQPMRYDESYSFMTFVNRSFHFLFYYPNPNNHVFHTILVKCFTSVLGPHPCVIRLPAFIAGLLCIPATLLLCKKIAGRQSGLLATMVVSILPYIVLYSTNARGYTMIVFMTIMLALFACFYMEHPSLFSCLLLSGTVAMGNGIIPTMLFSFAGIYLWLMVLLLGKGWSFSNIFNRLLLPSGFLISLFTFIGYTPSIIASGGIDLIVSNDTVQALPWKVFSHDIPLHILQVFHNMTRDVPLVAILLGIFLLVTGLANAFSKKNREIILLLPCLFLGAASVLILKHSIPFSRSWLYLIPFIAIVIDFGLSAKLALLSKRSTRLVSAAMVVLSIAFAMHIIAKNAIETNPDTGAFPEAAMVTSFLKPILNEKDTVHVTNPANFPLHYYFWYNGIPEQVWKIKPHSKHEYYIAQKGSSTISDFTNEDVKKILVGNDATIYMKTNGIKIR